MVGSNIELFYIKFTNYLEIVSFKPNGRNSFKRVARFGVVWKDSIRATDD